MCHKSLYILSQWMFFNVLICFWEVPAWNYTYSQLLDRKYLIYWHFFQLILKHFAKICSKRSEKYVSVSLKFKICHAKDPQKHVVPGTLQKQNIWVKNDHVDRIIQRSAPHFHENSQKYRTYKLISRHSVARYELVGLIFWRIIVKMWRRSLNDSVTVNVFNSDVLLLEGPWNYISSDGGRQPNTGDFGGPWHEIFWASMTQKHRFRFFRPFLTDFTKCLQIPWQFVEKNDCSKYQIYIFLSYFWIFVKMCHKYSTYFQVLDIKYIIEAQNISCQGPPKSSVFGRRPPSENMSFQGPSRSCPRSLRGQNIKRFATHFHDFSKTADLKVVQNGVPIRVC